jgi:hypothetical protein
MTFYIGRIQSDEMQAANIDVAVRCAEMRLRDLEKLHGEAAKIDPEVANHLKKEADRINRRFPELYLAQTLLNSFNKIEWPVPVEFAGRDIGQVDPKALEAAGFFDLARSLIGDDYRRLPRVEELEKVAEVLKTVGRPKLSEALARHRALLLADAVARGLA